MKRKIISLILAVVLCLSAFVVLPQQTQAAENVKIVRADFFAVGAYVYCDFVLDRKVKPARNFQTTERKEEPSDFPDAMVEQAITNFFLNDVSVSDYSDAFDGSQYAIMLHLEDTADGSTSVLRVLYMPIMIPGPSLNDTIKVEITDGFITAEYLKINPFVATYDPSTQLVTVVQEGGNPVTPTSPPVQSSAPASSAAQSSAPASSTAQSSAPASSADSDTQSEEPSQDVSEEQSEEPSQEVSEGSESSADTSSSDVITGGLGSYDITSTKADAVVDFQAKTITLVKSMKVSDLEGMLDVLEGLTLKFMSGSAEISGNDKLQDKDVMKVYKGEQLLGEFVMSVPAKESSNTWLVIVMIVLAAVLIGGAGLYLFVFKNKKTV